MMRTTGIRAYVTAAVCFAAISAPARAQESWDETVKNTVSSWWTGAKNTARIATLNPVTIDMCSASDKNALVADPGRRCGLPEDPRQ